MEHKSSLSNQLISPIAEVSKMLMKIRGTIAQLQEEGISKDDRTILKTRLCIVWGTIPEGQGATLWRRRRARDLYREVQNINHELFLAVILAIPPTICIQGTFSKVTDCLLRDNDHALFRLGLQPSEREFFESIATEQGFSENHHYRSFRSTLFPQDEDRIVEDHGREHEDHGREHEDHGREHEDHRQIQFAYSQIPLKNIDLLFQVMRKGIETSLLWTQERECGDTASSFGTALIPTGDKDCCFTITIGREDMMDGLRQLGLTPLKIP